MQEYILHAQIPSARHETALKVLQGFTQMPPVETCEQTLIYRQLQQPETVSKKKQSAQQAAQASVNHYRKLVRSIAEAKNGPVGPWTLRAEELPKAGVTNFISRPVQETRISDAELENFREGGKWTKYINQYIQTGTRFISNNIIIRIVRVLAVPEGTGALEPLDAPTPHLEDCTPVDPSGAWLAEVCIRVSDPSNARLVEQATKELEQFRKTMEGVIELKVAERLSLDPRVKSVA